MRIERHPRDHVPGIVIALAAGLHKGILASTPVNDDYQHLAYARQLFLGDLPLRDFWDLSTTLQEVVSAASQLVFGNRLLAEAVVIGVATAVAVLSTGSCSRSQGRRSCRRDSRGALHHRGSACLRVLRNGSSTRLRRGCGGTTCGGRQRRKR